jgi:hypothetical protein
MLAEIDYFLFSLPFFHFYFNQKIDKFLLKSIPSILDYKEYKPTSPTVSSKLIYKTEAEVIAAQKAWGVGLVQISDTNKDKGYDEAKKVAPSVLDASYGYAKGFPVLFKPTLASGKQTFRLSNDGALAYFVGGVEGFPDESGKGFAMKGRREVKSYNAGIQLLGNTALSMGNCWITTEMILLYRQMRQRDLTQESGNHR